MSDKRLIITGNDPLPIVSDFNRVMRFAMPVSALLAMQDGVFRIKGADVPPDAKVIDVQVLDGGAEIFVVPVVESGFFELVRNGDVPPTMASPQVEQIDFKTALQAAWGAGRDEIYNFDEWYNETFPEAN